MKSLVAQIIVDVLNKEMSMPADSVWLRDQNRLIPNDEKLYIIVGMINTFVISNESYLKEIVGKGGKIENHQISELQTQENIQIDILSRSNEVLTRNVEVIMAMQSFYCQQKQEENNFKIFRNPRSFINASSAEGGSELNRYSISVAAMVWYRKDKLIVAPNDVFTDFKQRVDDEKTIGTDKPLIQFEINSGGIVP